MRKLQSIQVLRAIAVLAVVYSHAFRTGRGTSGVDLFFVISGFIIARVSSDRSPLAFAQARFLRIFPLYLAAASPYVAWQLAHGSGITAKIAATVTLWPIWGGSYQEPLLPVAWSLYFELLFYVTVTLWLFSRRAAATAAATVVLVALVRPGPVTFFLLSPIIFEFAAGYGLARVRRFPLATASIGFGLLLLFAPVRAFEGATMLDAHEAGVRILMYGVPATMIVYGALGLDKRFAGQWANLPVWIGDASYSIYLTHLMPVHALDQWSPLARFLVAILLGLVVFTFVERPLLRILGMSGSRTTNRIAAALPDASPEPRLT
jgi:exopolysaccharide production protein ExoZ